MPYYIDQPQTSYFSTGLVNNRIWIIRSVETDLRRWILVEGVINIDAYLFLVFTDLTVTLRVQG